MSLNNKKLKKVVIDGEQVVTIEQFYDTLVKQLHLPAHFGRNLDALWDVLTVDVAGPVEIVWENAGLSRTRMGETAGKLFSLLNEVGEERPDITIKLS